MCPSAACSSAKFSPPSIADRSSFTAASDLPSRCSATALPRLAEPAGVKAASGAIMSRRRPGVSVLELEGSGLNSAGVASSSLNHAHLSFSLMALLLPLFRAFGERELNRAGGAPLVSLIHESHGTGLQ